MDIFTLRCDKLPADTRVMRLSGYEGLSRLYSFTLELVIPGDEGLAFDMAEAINATASLHIHAADGTERSIFHGVLAEVDWVQEVADSSIYRVVLVPRLWKLGLSQHSSVYPDQTIQEIVQEVMEANGFTRDDYTFDLGPTRYDKLPHVAQYRESDWAFLCRRLEREGLYFYFDQLDSHEKLIITDDREKAKRSGSVQYFPTATDHTVGAEGFTSFVCRHQARAKQVKVREFDYLRPTADLNKFNDVSDLGKVEVRSHDENYTVEADGQRLATVRAQELKCREVVFEARGHAFDVKPGYLFELTHHPRPSFTDKLYLAVTVTHEGSQGVTNESSPDQEPEQPTYTIRVEAIPEAAQYRPGRVTPIPRIYGTEMALIDGEQSSPYAQIDQHGRYKVQVFFDEHEPRPGKASMWVRMLQPHGGAHEGFHFPLRKGTEVMLVFLGGDPDRPVIAGMVPNTDTPSPVTEENASQNVILTGGGTRIEIEDNDGSQYLRMSTPPESTSLHMGAADDDGYNVHLDSTGHALVRLGGNEDIQVEGYLTEQVQGDVTEKYASKHETTVDSDHKAEVKGKEDYKVHGNQKIKVLSNREVKVTGNQKHEIGGNEEIKVTGNRTVQVMGNRSYTVMGNQTHTTTGNVTQTTTGNVTQTTTGNVTQTNAANVTQTTAGSRTETNAADKKESTFGATAEFKGGAVSETFLGIKNENIIVAKIDSVVGMMMETIIGMKVGTHIGPSIEYSGSLKFSKRILSLADLTVKVENAGPKIEKAAAAIKSAAITIFP